ncbi:MAG: hypothetical protein ABJ205_08725 [Erythrobacter sp.]|uniref:hypothetical protein n=1 Tax=Erythrobacter sp. TaxID=1042 RepID=UPI003264EF00
MSSRFGFSPLSLPEAPDRISDETFGLLAEPDLEPSKLAEIAHLLNERLYEYGQMREELGKFEGFKVPGELVNSQNLKHIKRAVWLQLELFMTARGWRLKYTQKRVDFSVKPTSKRNVKRILKEAFEQNREDERITSTNRIRRPRRRKETHLSIKAKVPQLVMISLAKDANIQFNRSGAAISTSKEYESAFLEAGVFTKGSGQRTFTAVNQIKNEEDKNDDCKFAYFIVDPRDPQPKQNSGGGTPDQAVVNSPKAFNIHLDLIGPKSKKSEDKPKYHIPIIIDPDIRHPGGYGGG